MKLANIENPSSVQKSGTYTGRVIGNFVFKCPIFVTTARGPSEMSCNDTIKFTDPEKALWYQNLGIISHENRVITNTTVRGPQCGVWWKQFSFIVNPDPSNLIQKTNNRQRLTVCFCNSRKSFSLRSCTAKLWCFMAKQPKRKFCWQPFTPSVSPIP